MGTYATVSFLNWFEELYNEEIQNNPIITLKLNATLTYFL